MDMISRIWHGWTSTADADAYQRLLEQEIAPGIAARGIAGVLGPRLLRRDALDGEVEFVTVMSFSDWDAVGEFAGADPQAAVVPPGARRLLRRFDEHSAHYEVVLPADI
jgi:hypothetical protein